jgi:hypothetical protein
MWLKTAVVSAIKAAKTGADVNKIPYLGKLNLE